MKTPTHESVAQRAEEIWQASGRPTGRDTEFWFEAEHQLAAEAAERHEESVANATSQRVFEALGDAVFAARNTDVSVPVSEAPDAHQPPQPSQDQAAETAVRQRKEARAPKFPQRFAPKAAPPESGKPIWRLPHSS